MRKFKITVSLLVAAGVLCSHQAYARDDLPAKIVQMFNAFSNDMGPQTIEAAFPGRIIADQGPFDARSRDWTYSFGSKDRAYSVNFFQETDRGRPVRSAIFAFSQAHALSDLSEHCVAVRPIVLGLVKSGWSLPQIKRGTSLGGPYANLYLRRGAATVSIDVKYDAASAGGPPEAAALAGCVAGFDSRTDQPSIARIMTAKPFGPWLFSPSTVAPAS